MIWRGDQAATSCKVIAVVDCLFIALPACKAARDRCRSVRSRRDAARPDRFASSVSEGSAQPFAGSLGDVSVETWRDRFLALDERGHVSKSIVYPAILSEFGGDLASADILLSDYRNEFCRYAISFPGMQQTVTTLRAHGLKIGLVTNGETAFQTRSIEALGLHLMADAILISEQEGLRKPHRALFMQAADRLGVSPAACLFIGDNPVADILGAHAAGMKTAWFAGTAIWPADLPMPGASIAKLSDILARLELPDRL